ncbi:subtilisin-like protease SBT4.3 [Chenopodium quinoa]|uniref:subtilisin-like protease SBT4.3 n=1 Tax=Chenopodium quinoa TaxID=63459 RepID=UPI000B7833DA|nr:subtilisin-like protease SBT4.3 [Chenopodium quinoa]
MGSISEEYAVTSEYHINILQQVLEGSTAEESLVRSYKRSFNGFAARLTEKESKNLNSMKEVVSVFPSKTLNLQTTRSWDFLGLIESDVVPRNLTSESNVILGSFDTGIWPESPSFSDDGIGPPPKKWKGACKGGKDFTCNNKVIGASTTTFDSARDEIGHGSHTASTAAGRHVDHTNFYGLAEGIARGAVPSARLAVYKVCGRDGCQDSDVLTAFDEAIADGVDLITLSLGSSNPTELDLDSIAIGSYHAIQKGILTVHSAGNSGNRSFSVSSVAPWLFSVAASTIDRRILDKVVLGNGKTLLGYSVNSFQSKRGLLPLVYGVGPKECVKESIQYCGQGCLDESVKGKIVVCDISDGSGIIEAYKVGALGVLSRINIDFSQIYPLPAIEFESNEFQALKSYLNSTKNPKANILKSFSFNDTSSPYVIGFSSRGPNLAASDILKPDITAPGVEIIAAFSPLASLTGIPGDKRSVNYTIFSGTSMSCPHVAGASVYIKSLHPDWSPSAIKSALMTTAQPISPSKNKDAEFAYGSGHLDPVKAANPGLVYVTEQDEYLTFFCKLGYDKDQIALITGNRKFSCPKESNETSSLAKDVNYPSLSVMVEIDIPINIKFSRTVTNVGVANSTYTVKVESPKEIKVTVNPTSLSFKSLNEKKTYEVSVVGKALTENSSIISASLVWSDGQHNVRSPLVVYSDFYHGVD